MTRVHPIALRVGNSINWSQDVRHAPLIKLIKFIFQERVASKPMIKASVNSIWVDITVFENSMNPSIFKNQTTFKLNLEGLNILQNLGLIEEKTDSLLKNDKHYSKLEKLDTGESELGRKLQGYILKNEETVNNLKLLNIHYDRPIYLRITPITSPYLNAQVAASYFAKRINVGRGSTPKSCIGAVREFVNNNVEQ